MTAIRILLTILSFAPQAAPDPARLGWAAMQAGKPVEAERQFRLAIAAKKGSAEVRKGLGMALAAQEKYREALPWFEELCRAEPRKPDHCYYAGRTRFSLGDFAGALRDFDVALRSGHRPERTWAGMALAYERMEEWDKAQNAFERAGEAGREEYARFRAERGLAKPAVREWGYDEMEFGAPVRNGAAGRKHLPETMIAGVAVFDMDGDGKLDVFVPNGGTMPGLEKSDETYWNRMYRNQGGRVLEDVTRVAGLEGVGYGMHAAAGDYDGDGRQDLFVSGVRESRLYRNMGEGKFADATRQVGLPEAGLWTVAAAWLDYDRDGHLDLFVVRYVQWEASTEPECAAGGQRTYCHPEHYRGLPNALYRNNGDGTFTDVSIRTGLGRAIGKGMGVAVADVNQDGWPDLFVANDTTPNFLFLNRVGKGFSEVAMEAGVALREDGRPVSAMGAAFADVDGDGQLDFLVSALSDESFLYFRGLGEGRFAEAGTPSRVTALSRPYTGWGVVAGDFNGDGKVDFAVAGGHVQDNAESFSGRAPRQPVLLFLNRGDGSFQLQRVSKPSFWRGIAAGDLDGDGKLDLVVTRLNERPVVFWGR